MKGKSLLLTISFSLFLAVSAFAQPAIVKGPDGATRFMIDGKPFVMFSGELHNSTSTSESYMEKIGVWKQMKDCNFNTVIASCSWDVIEPEEGKYDFSSVDHVIRNARNNGLKVVLIWFASWKNGNSTYAPSYIKRNPKKYPLVQAANGNYLNVLTTFQEASLNADKKAFVALMSHIKAIDPDNTVIMIQVENEVGILGSPRDYSAPAQKAWNAQVPADLINYLLGHKGSLYPELEKVWAANGYKTKGSWEDIFGKSYPDSDNWQTGFPYYTEEIFQAYHYAKYLQEIITAGKAVHNIPMYVNTWLKQPGMEAPGQYPSGGPLPEVLDIWRSAAPAIDLSAPDIYADDFEWITSQYTLSDNPLFIPECRIDAAKALYAYGEHDALCFAPFGFDGSRPSAQGDANSDFENLGKCYGILSGMGMMLPDNFGSDKMRGVRITEQSPTQSVEMGDYVLNVRSSVRNGTAQSGALIIQTTEDEFYIVGINVSFSFATKDPKAKGRVLTDVIEEGTFIDGKWIPGRRLNGDENNVRINGVGAERVVLYKSIVN